MATIYVFNNNTGVLERYTREPSDPMPYNIGGTLRVREFMGTQQAGWTDLNTMISWNILRNAFARPIRVFTAFTTISDEGCLADPYHYFGQSLVISSLQPSNAQLLHDTAVQSNAFNTTGALQPIQNIFSVSNIFMPANTHRINFLPYLFLGARNNYVLTLQSALSGFGYPLVVDGIFGPNTDAAVRRYQDDRLLTDDGIIARLEWEAILNMGCI